METVRSLSYRSQAFISSRESEPVHRRLGELTPSASLLPETSVGSSIPMMSMIPQGEIAGSPNGVEPKDGLADLLQNYCSRLYVDSTVQSAGNGCVVLDIGGLISGASIEMVCAGAFLQIRLNAPDDRIAKKMLLARARLIESLSAATHLTVQVDVAMQRRENNEV